MDTIFAVSSGAAPAAIAVMRISGARAFGVAEALCGSLPLPRMAAVRKLVAPASGGLLDRALVIVFPGPATATGEDLVELHLHGGRAVVSAVERVLAGELGLRRADPGEFTRRALMAGRIDLTEAEGLGDLLAAETEGQRRAAMAGAEGGIRRRIAHWSAALNAIAARVEAALDFSDEDDVPAEDLLAMARQCRMLVAEMDIVLAAPPIERLRDGIRVVLAGPTNSGKSTLLNRLAQREAAIVSPIAGTTRDRIEVPVSRDGLAYILIDTAGLREATDPIEAIGIVRAQDAIETADIILWLGDDAPPGEALWLLPRVDLPEREMLINDNRLAVSAATDIGIKAVWDAITQRAAGLVPGVDQLALNRRQHDLARACRNEVAAAADENDLILIAERLRSGSARLDEITGLNHTENMLDALFGKFCIGK